MGLLQSKDQLLYQQVISGNIQAIIDLRTEGAGLEWVDKERKTPLLVASTSPHLYDVAKSLIQLGANVDAYCPGRFGGTPLHHAASRGLEQTVKLLLEHGANALIMNDDCQTPLDIARIKGYSSIVRAIEGHLCLFSGWLREIHGLGFLELLTPQLLSRRIWAVVLPCGSRNQNSRKPFRLELAMYTDTQDALPRTIVPLWKANLEEPDLNQADPVVIISDISRIPRRWKRRRAIRSSQETRTTGIKFAPVQEGETLQLQQFSNACKGIPQVVRTSFPFDVPIPSAPEDDASSISDEDDDNDEEEPPDLDATAGPRVNASNNVAYLTTATSHKESLVSTFTAHTAPGSQFEIQRGSPSRDLAQPVQSQDNDNNNSSHITQTARECPSPVLNASAPPAEDEGPIRYPSVDIGPVNISSTSVEADAKKGNDSVSSSCTICLDAAIEGACIPCGHMAGCMVCLNEIKAKKWGFPLCRGPIDQVVRIYSA